MEKRTVSLADGRRMIVNDNEWTPVTNLKQFDAKNTEIVRVTRHKSGLLTRVYVMRSVDGIIAKEQNHIVVGDDVSDLIAKAISECGLSKITKVA